jgi:hypothetical protein
VEVVASLSQGRTSAAQCGLFTHKSVPVIFEPSCMLLERGLDLSGYASGPFAGSCEYDGEHSGTIKYGEFCDCLRNT